MYISTSSSAQSSTWYVNCAVGNQATLIPVGLETSECPVWRTYNTQQYCYAATARYTCHRDGQCFLTSVLLLGCYVAATAAVACVLYPLLDQK